MSGEWLVFDCATGEVKLQDIDPTILAQTRADIAAAQPVTSPPPNIADLVTALTASSSIDQTTKNRLVKALEP